MTVQARMSAEGSLHQRWTELREHQAGLRARDAASRLGVSEAELIASGCGETAVRLDMQDPGRLIESMAPLGEVLALTRNEHVVIEKTGPLEHVEVYRGHGVGSVVGDAIDLRLYLQHWVRGFAVADSGRKGLRRSLQFFDARGVAVHKVFLTDQSDQEAFDRLVSEFADEDQTPGVAVSAHPPAASVRPDDAVDAAGLRAAWAQLLDTHEFLRMLNRFAVGRMQALRLAGSDWAWPVALDAPRRVLESARELQLPIMLFVASPGTVQIHIGPVQRLAVVGDWYNVLDPGFNLHLRESGVAFAWVVRKPTVDGVVTGLELFDAEGDLLLQCFGKRKGGQSEAPAWRALMERLPPLAV